MSFSVSILRDNMRYKSQWLQYGPQGSSKNVTASSYEKIFKEVVDSALTMLSQEPTSKQEALWEMGFALKNLFDMNTPSKVLPDEAILRCVLYLEENLPENPYQPSKCSISNNWLQTERPGWNTFEHRPSSYSSPQYMHGMFQKSPFAAEKLRASMEASFKTLGLTWAGALEKMPIIGPFLLFASITARVKSITSPIEPPKNIPDLAKDLEEKLLLTASVPPYLKPCMLSSANELFQRLPSSGYLQKLYVDSFACPGTLSDVGDRARVNDGALQAWSSDALETYQKLLAVAYKSMTLTSRRELIRCVPELPKDILLESSIKTGTIFKYPPRSGVLPFFEHWGAAAPAAQDIAFEQKNLKIGELIHLLDGLLT